MSQVETGGVVTSDSSHCLASHSTAQHSTAHCGCCSVTHPLPAVYYVNHSQHLASSCCSLYSLPPHTVRTPLTTQCPPPIHYLLLHVPPDYITPHCHLITTYPNVPLIITYPKVPLFTPPVSPDYIISNVPLITPSPLSLRLTSLP